MLESLKTKPLRLPRRLGPHNSSISSPKRGNNMEELEREGSLGSSEPGEHWDEVSWHFWGLCCGDVFGPQSVESEELCDRW